MEDRRVPNRGIEFTHFVDVTTPVTPGKLATTRNAGREHPTLRERSEPSTAHPSPPRWCRACGAVPRAGKTQWHRVTCDPCGTPLDLPEPGPSRIGRVVLVGNRLLARHA